MDNINYVIVLNIVYLQTLGPHKDLDSWVLLSPQYDRDVRCRQESSEHRHKCSFPHVHNVHTSLRSLDLDTGYLWS